MEAQAAGVICFYRQNGALGETIGNRGVALPLDMKPEDIVNIVVKTLADPSLCGKIQEKAKTYALARDWSAQADKFLRLYKEEEGAENRLLESDRQ